MKKRIISLLLALCLIVTVFSSATFATETVKTYHTVYLNTALEVDGDGSETAPHNSLISAIDAIEQSGKDAGIINFIGTLSVTGNIPTHTKEITFTGDGIFNYINNFSIGGPTVFENVAIKVGSSSGSWLMLRTNGNPLTFGEGVTKASGSASINLVAGADTSGKDIELNLLSGSFNSVYVGSFSDSAININKTNVYVGSGVTVNNITLGANGSGLCTFTGDTFITVNGDLKDLIYTTKGPAPVFKGALTILYNHGLYRLYGISETLTAEKGVYIMDCEKMDGSYLEVTDTVGEFNVVGDNDVIAYSKADGTLFEPANKNIVFGVPGNYAVKFYNSDIEYINGGSEIKVKKDTTLNFSELSFIEPEGKLFIGWTDSNGNAVSSGEFKVGTTLKAKYINYTDTDFVIKDTQIRTTSETVESQGLRFIIQRNSKFESDLKSSVGGVSFGSIYMPTNYAAGTDMEIGSTHKVYSTDGEYKPKKVEAKNIYARSNTAEQYTLCITDVGSELTNDKYFKFYTVKGYAEYRDINGVARVLYTDYLTTNLYKVAMEEKEANPESYNAICDTIIDYVENQRITDLTADGAEYGFNKWLTGPLSDSTNKNANEASYLLNNNLLVRDITIGNNDGKTPITIAAFSDIHFSNYNKLDEILDNPSAKAQWYATGVASGIIRKMGRVDQGSGSVQNSNKLMEFGSFFDRTVIAGDVMDYFTYGSAELVQKLILDRSIKGNTLIALGNHETAELFAQVTAAKGFRERFTQNYKYLKLNEKLWPNDIYYHSEVVTKGDKQVRIVTMDNQSIKYLDASGIYDKLSADIADSRKNNIPILIFQHVPMHTYNENSSTLVPFEADRGAQLNTAANEQDLMGNNNFYIKRGSNLSNYTSKVYNLISSNADVIRGVFCGHVHNNFYCEIASYSYNSSTGQYDPVYDENGVQRTIPQYVIGGSYMGGEGGASVLKISVY